ncbi:hypothetical protein ACO0QE_002886 [Hanseniaspora vineae]
MSLQSTEAVLSIIYICYCILNAKSAELKAEDLRRADRPTQSSQIEQCGFVPENHSIEEFEQRKTDSDASQKTIAQQSKELEERGDENVGPKIQILNATPGSISKTDKAACSRKYVAFEHSSNILALDGDHTIKLSTNHGLTWDSLPGWPEEMSEQLSLHSIQLQRDTTYRSCRAYLFSKKLQNSVLYFTDNAGATWTQWNLGSIQKQISKRYSYFKNKEGFSKVIEIDKIKSLPETKDVIMISIHVQDTNVALDFFLQFLSADHGLTWKLLDPVDAAKMPDNMYVSTTCKFGNDFRNDHTKSETLILSVVFEKSTGITKKSSGLQSFSGQAGKLHASHNLGKTWQVVDDLKDELVAHLKVTGLYIFAITASLNNTETDSSSLYVSNNGGQNFQKIDFDICIPESYTLSELLPSGIQTYGSIVVVYQQVTIEVTNKHNEAPQLHRAQCTFLSDSTGMNYYLIDQLLDEKPCITLGVQRTIYNIPGCKKTFMLFSQHTENNQVCKILATKISHDYGASWSDVKIDSPKSTAIASSTKGTLKSLTPKLLEENGFSPLSQIFTLNAVVSGDSCTELNSKTKQRTFITRDGGELFELSLEFPTKVIRANQDKVMVALPQMLQASGTPISEIYYSFDQGRSWEKYELNLQFKPANVMALPSDGSKARFLFSGTAYLADICGGKPQKQDIGNLDFIVDFSDMCSALPSVYSSGILFSS